MFGLRTCIVKYHRLIFILTLCYFMKITGKYEYHTLLYEKGVAVVGVEAITPPCLPYLEMITI